MVELTPDQARARCHKNLVAGLRLIPSEERVQAIAAALREVEVREKRRQAVDHDRDH
jgi:hypothetical protein